MTVSENEQETVIPSNDVLSAVASEHRRAVLRSLDRTDENITYYSARNRRV